MRSSVLRKLLLVLALLLAIWRVGAPDATKLLRSDFVPYWAAARLFLAGGNPYAPAELSSLERKSNLTDRKRPWMMWNPPWALSVVIPFGLLSLPRAALLWFLLQFTIVFASSFWLWRIYRGPPSSRWLAIVLPGTFLPVAVALLDSQMTPLVLLGITAFLHFVVQRKYKSAGVALALLALKPQLCIPFACALVLWCRREGRWQLLAAATGGMAVLLIPVWARPELVAQYRHVISRIWDDAAPAWGGLLRALFGYEKVWLQYLPTLAGLGWTILYWKTHRLQWGWTERVPMLLLVGFVAAPYAWTYDEVILLPVFIAAAVYILGQQDRRLALWTTAFYLAMNVAMFALNARGVRDAWYIWNVPLWLLAFMLLKHRRAAVPAAA